MTKKYLSFSILVIALMFSNTIFAADTDKAATGPRIMQAPAQSAEPNFASMDPNTVMAKYDGQKLTLQDVKYLMPLVTPESARQLAQQWVDLQMMYEAAKKRGITNDPKTKLLSELGNKSLCARELMNKIASEVNVPDANVREYYEKNKYSDPQLFEPNRFSFTHIRTATAQEANAVKKRIESGEDIEGIAKEVSIAPDARNGGVVKKLPESMLLQQYGKAFVDALKASSEGQVIGPIKTNDGYEVVRHEGKLIAKAYPYEMVKGIIKQRLESTTKAEAQQKFLEDLKKADESKVYISPLIEAPKPAAQEQKLRTEPNLPVDKTKNKTDNSKQK